MCHLFPPLPYSRVVCLKSRGGAALGNACNLHHQPAPAGGFSVLQAPSAVDTASVGVVHHHHRLPATLGALPHGFNKKGLLAELVRLLQLAVVKGARIHLQSRVHRSSSSRSRSRSRAGMAKVEAAVLPVKVWSHCGTACASDALLFTAARDTLCTSRNRRLSPVPPSKKWSADITATKRRPLCCP
jgi:hypothetical protein